MLRLRSLRRGQDLQGHNGSLSGQRGDVHENESNTDPSLLLYFVDLLVMFVVHAATAAAAADAVSKQ